MVAFIYLTLARQENECKKVIHFPVGWRASKEGERRALKFIQINVSHTGRKGFIAVKVTLNCLKYKQKNPYKLGQSKRRFTSKPDFRSYKFLYIYFTDCD